MNAIGSIFACWQTSGDSILQEALQFQGEGMRPPKSTLVEVNFQSARTRIPANGRHFLELLTWPS
jgi:hypothetical protein